MENDEAVFFEYVATVKQKKKWFDKIPKDKSARVEGVILFEIRNNKIYKMKDIFDYNDFWAQLGYLVDVGEYQLPSHLKAYDREKINK